MLCKHIQKPRRKTGDAKNSEKRIKLLVSILSILLALSVSALITVLIYNGTRDKRSANFGIKVEINGAPDEDGVIYAQAGVQYEIKITPTGNGENGFCVLEADNGAVYHTSQLTTHPTAQYGAKHSITFIIVCEDDARITLSEH